MMFPATTALYAGFLGLMFIWLSWKVVDFRMKKGVGVGDAGDPVGQRRIRVHANFAEYVPLALLLMAFAEAAGFSAWLLHGLGITLVIGRVIHAQGLYSRPGVSQGRYWGTVATWSVLLSCSALAVLAGLTPIRF